MSVDDFDRLMPEEFNAIIGEWRREQRRAEAFWLSGVRLHAAICVAPHCKKAPRPEDLFSIPDIDTQYRRAEAPAPDAGLTKEERKRRLDALKKACSYE